MQTTPEIAAEYCNGPQIIAHTPGIADHVLAYRCTPHAVKKWTPDNGQTWTPDETEARRAFGARMPSTIAEACRMIDAECLRLSVNLQTEARPRSVAYIFNDADYDAPWFTMPLAFAAGFIATLRTMHHGDDAAEDRVEELLNITTLCRRTALAPGEHYAPDGTPCRCTAEDRRDGCGCR